MLDTYLRLKMSHLAKLIIFLLAKTQQAIIREEYRHMAMKRLFSIASYVQTTGTHDL